MNEATPALQYSESPGQCDGQGRLALTLALQIEFTKANKEEKNGGNS